MPDVDFNQLIALEQQERQLQEQQGGVFQSESFRFGQLMIEDDPKAFPSGIAEKFWITFDKEMALSNLDDKKVKWFMLNMDIAKINYMMSGPEMDLDFKEIKDIDMVKMKMLAKLSRSTGGMLRERGLFAQQHRISQFMNGEQGMKGGGGVLGWFKNALGGIGGGGGGGK